MNIKYLFAVFITLSFNIIISQSISMNKSNVVINFSSQPNIDDWKVVDDVVMGGVSNSKIVLDENNKALFYGHVSTKNNGGFSSVRCSINTLNLKPYSSFVIRVKGDQKNYQFRVKSSNNDYHSYKYEFSTNNKWQEIVIPFEKLEPTFRGRKLNIPNFSNQLLEEICFLISNKREENFKLLIDCVKLQ